MNKSLSHSEVSKFLSYILRHAPESIGLELDNAGWANIDELIKKSNNSHLNKEIIQQVVSSSDKQRFKISGDGLMIRANQGHSIKIDLSLTPHAPPKMLYHGTATRFLDSIMNEGLRAGARNHVHLSNKIETASAVGRRYGKLVLLEVNSEQMHQKGYPFFLSDNQVWLTESVPPEFISLHTPKDD